MAAVTCSLACIQSIALASAALWILVSALCHVLTPLLWPDYAVLQRRDKLLWCNRASSALHAAVLVYNQMYNIHDPVLHAKPLTGVTDAHFRWGAFMLGYLTYDTLFSLVFWRCVGSADLLLHHAVALACCCFGVFWQKLALFGMAVQVYFEGTTPLLHMLGGLKTMGLHHTRAYAILGAAFVCQFLVFRVLIGSYYGLYMAQQLLQLEQLPAWGISALASYACLCLLNYFWMFKLLRMAGRLGSGSAPAQRAEHPMPGLQPPLPVKAVPSCPDHLPSPLAESLKALHGAALTIRQCACPTTGASRQPQACKSGGTGSRLMHL